MGTEFSWSHAITKLISGTDLTEEEASAAMGEIMEGAATPAQIAGFVVALRAKGESDDEVAGLVRTMRGYSQRIELDGTVLDTCGTGGDRVGTFNVSTAAALVCAGAGATVAKHGNRVASSRCGSADVLEALGVKIDLPPDGVKRCIEETGIGFCFAPVFHPAMRHAGVPRRELGVADPRMVNKMVGALARLGSEHVIAFNGDDGLDELSISGPSRVVELQNGEVTRWELRPGEVGIEEAPLDAIKGGTADENARIVRDVLGGDKGPRRDVVVLNAAAGLAAAGIATDIGDGVQRAAEAIDSGRAAEALENLARASSS